MPTFGGPKTAWCEDQTIAVGLRSVVDDPLETLVTPDAPPQKLTVALKGLWGFRSTHFTSSSAKGGRVRYRRSCSSRRRSSGHIYAHDRRAL
jgi:hypothetical protein